MRTPLSCSRCTRAPTTSVGSHTWVTGGSSDRARRSIGHHAPPVEEMGEARLGCRGEVGPLHASDGGCGNGWVVRWLRAHAHCIAATGADCSASMIAKARSIDTEGTYVLADLREWTPPD